MPDEPSLLLAQWTCQFFLQELCESQNGVQGGSQLMAHAREELALESIGSLRFPVAQFQLLVCDPDLFSRLLLRGYVANDGRDAESVVCFSRAEADFDRKPGSVPALRFEDIPAPVLRRAEDLFLDWLGSALAGKGARPVEAIERFARTMGPLAGESEVLISRRGTSPLFAAMVNAASSHFAEQDDVHNGAVFHPGTVVFPPALAVAQAIGCSGSEFLTAAVAGYEVGIRVGEFLGRTHYQVFHTTGTAGTLAAAAAVGRLLNLSAEQMLDAFGSAGTQSAGLWEFLRDAADSKQLHTAKAAADGLLGQVRTD